MVSEVEGPRVLGLIPARGGSQSLPRKNIRLLAGRPLIAHSIEAGLASRTVGRVVVTTDDPEIAGIAKSHGADVPFLRPAELARDDTLDLPVFQHALAWFSDHEGWRPEIVVHLRPTSPLRRPEDIDRAVELLESAPEADSVRSVAEPLENPYKMWSVTGEGWLSPLVPSGLREPYNMPRQALPRAYWQTGAIDAIRRRTITSHGSMTGARILPLVVDALGVVDIDTESSLELVEWLIASGKAPRARNRPDERAGQSSSGRRRPRLLVLDFDGVMTDNRVWVNEAGEESVSFDRGDGLGIRLLASAGVEVIVLSTEENPVVAARCRKLAIRFLQGLADKAAALSSWLDQEGIDGAEVAYLGNDVNDLGCMAMVGLAIAVADAHHEVRRAAHLVLDRPGGFGAVREACDLIRSWN